MSCPGVLRFACEVESRNLEGMCTCLCEGDTHYIWDKVVQCFRAPALHSASCDRCPRWMEKAYQVWGEIDDTCSCDVTYREAIG
jgi:hypothetical protein